MSSEYVLALFKKIFNANFFYLIFNIDCVEHPACKIPDNRTVVSYEPVTAPH